MSNSNSTKSSNCPAHSPQELEPSENFYGVFHEDMIISKFGEIVSSHCTRVGDLF